VHRAGGAPGRAGARTSAECSLVPSSPVSDTTQQPLDWQFKQ